MRGRYHTKCTNFAPKYIASWHLSTYICHKPIKGGVYSEFLLICHRFIRQTF